MELGQDTELITFPQMESDIWPVYLHKVESDYYSSHTLVALGPAKISSAVVLNPISS